MKYSILIPIYNGEKYIKTCVESLLQLNTKSDLEIILVDDGSQDSTPQICDTYEKKYPGIVKVIHQSNQGQLCARVRAIKESQGDYCVFMDIDDALVDNAFEILDAKLCQFDYPDMLIYSFFYESEKGERRPANKLYETDTVFTSANKQQIYSKFFDGTALNNVWTKAVKKSILDKIEFNYSKFYDLRCSEDRLHSMLMVEACESVAYIPTPIYCYRLVEGSVTRKYTIDGIGKFNILPLYEVEKSFLQSWGMETEEWNAVLDAQWVKQTIYVLDLYYKNVPFFERGKVLRYDWGSFIPETVLKSIFDNEHLNETQKRIWGWMINRKFGALRIYFFKNTVKKRIRTLFR